MLFSKTTKTMNRKNLIKKHDLAFSRWKRFKTSDLHCFYKNSRNIVNSEIVKAKKKFYENKFKLIVDTRKTWKAIRDMESATVTVLIT